MTARRTLSRSDIEAVYDRVGAWQDTQAFYEAPAFDVLVARGGFGDARSVVEVGCGTGTLAERLLQSHCPPPARYVGYDLSGTMVRLARARLGAFGARATVHETNGGLTFDAADGTYDRVVATYLLDLLSRENARTFLGEAHRLLREHGRLCLAGLTWGRALMPWCVSGLWNALHRIRPAWVGGCRPLRQRALLDETRWAVRAHSVVTAWGVPSEVLVATPI